MSPNTSPSPAAAAPGGRSSRRLAAAVAAAAAVGAVALSLPAIAFADDGMRQPASQKLELKDGTLEWGVKESFRRYVTGMAHGTIEVADGAQQAADNGFFTFTNGTGTYDTSTHAVSTAFEGSVRFRSTLHGFDIELAGLQVETEGRAGTITADVTAQGTTDDDVELATLDLSEVRPGQGEGGAMTFAGIPVELTAEGAKAFNGMYQEGQALDPATLTVKPVQAPGPGPSSPATPSASSSGEPSGHPTAQPTTTTAPSTSPSGSSGGERPAPSGEIADGNLDWGVKKSFRDYVTGPIGGGTVQLSAGAAKNGEIYRFPTGSGSYDADRGTLDAAFAGAVRFLAHKEGGEYALDLKFSDLKVRTDGAEGDLIADVSSKDRESGEVTESDDLTVATLELPDGGLEPTDDVLTLDDVPATLTADGAKAFGGFYEAGAALDPVTVAVSLDEDANLPGGEGDPADGSGDTSSTASAGTTGGSGSLASTGSGTPAGALLGAAAGLAVVGGAAFAATRGSRAGGR
ncbi:HtaA domain-containing protein [Streptomyces sp. NPDC048639]|uniref:HtaA domain-containing protein n=1 Tax=Streptomyces sp. NPDC048639 TaxID=3365581 RepID=UPI00371D66AC